MGLEPALRTSCAMLLNLRFCQVCEYINESVKFEGVSLETVGFQTPRGSMPSQLVVNNAAGKMAVCISMVMLGCCQPHPNPNPNPNPKQRRHPYSNPVMIGNSNSTYV